MSISLEKSNKVFFDLETNGFGGSGSIYNCFHRIIQISARIHDHSFCTYVDPEVHIPKPSTDIHRITNDDVAGKETFYHAFAEFLRFVYKNTVPAEPTILIAHNAFGFDIPMLQKECARVGVSIPPEFLVYDTLPVYRREFPLKNSKKLGELYKERFGKEMENAHDALADSIGLQELFIKELQPKFDTVDICTLSSYNTVSNEEPVQNICGIGPATAWKIGKYAKTPSVLVHHLRKLMTGKTDEDIERFIRGELNQHQESFVFSIWFAITNGHGRPASFYFDMFCSQTRFPLCDDAFRNYWGPKAASIFESANIRSAEMLRRHYYYVLREDDGGLRQLADTVGCDFHLIKMLVTI